MPVRVAAEQGFEFVVRHVLIANAVLIELAASGYGAMRVADALTLAGVSKADFEAEFADKDACLFAAYEQLTERLLRRTAEACGRGDEWPARVRGGLEALLEELAGTPEMAQVAIRIFPAIGPADEVVMLAVGAAEAIVFEEIEAGRAAQLPALGPAILFSVLVPFLGPEAASAEMQRAQRER